MGFTPLFLSFFLSCLLGLSPLGGRSSPAHAWAPAAGAAAGAAAGGAATGAAAAGEAAPHAWALHDALQHCEQLEDLYQAIHDDLSIWKPDGIDRATMAASISKFTTRGNNKGMTLAFVNGTAYVVEATLDATLGHHANILFTYMQVFLELQRLFGALIPDVEFVVASSDRPMVMLNSTRPYLPVFRFCSSDVHADIQIPIFHFYTKRYTQSMLDIIPEVNREYPWQEKKEVLFGRFSNYLRFVAPNEPLLARLGTGSKTICRVDSPSTSSCRVRQHLIIWALRHSQLLDIKSSPRVPMREHAAYKYLLHMDGQALSSRMDFLLPLNSLVFKEASGYTTFYHHLLKPKVHYVPVWKQTPDDILSALAWAKAHDDQARQIAFNAQQFAIKYLNKRSRTCYLFTLLREFSKLLKYKVSPEHELREQEGLRQKAAKQGGREEDAPTGGDGSTLRGDSSAARARCGLGAAGAEARGLVPGELGCWRTVEQYLAEVAAKYEGGKYLTTLKEEF